MRKDSLILLLMLSVFALVGADCQSPFDNKDDKKRPLPDRAFASSPLLRAYYDSRTFPEEMRELKIPEGTSFDDDELTIEFDMGGTVAVTEVRTHLLLMPPKGKLFDDVELICRVVAPDGTASSWKPVQAQVADTLDFQAEVAFLYEFDGINSDGNWKVQLKDYADDGDGRCLFRNASLHINAGETAGLVGGSSGNDTISGVAGLYGAIPEASGERQAFDPGWFGINRMLRNDFTIANSFFVRSCQLTISFYIPKDVEAGKDILFMLVAPSGNWLAGAFPETTVTPGPTVLDTLLSDELTLRTITYPFGGSTAGFLFNLNGEPSAGTWSLYLVDVNKDGNAASVTTDESLSATTLSVGTSPMRLDLFGAN